MMKIRKFCAVAALLLACASPAQAAAMAADTSAPAMQTETASAASAPTTDTPTTDTPTTPDICYPVDVQMSADGLTIKKIYDVPKTTSPDQIPQDDFDRGDMHYTFRDMLRIEMPDIDRKVHTETVTVSSSSDNANDVMALLPKSKAVTTGDGYSGTAYLDVSSISTKVSGTESVSAALRTTREYPNMPNMDMTVIPKTITENGSTLTFSTIDWKSENEETDNLGTAETRYTATVTYTGTSTSSRTTGYTVTAQYAGEVSHRNNEAMRYIVIYTGAPIPPQQTIEPPDLAGLLREISRQQTEPERGIPVSWVLCVVFGLLALLFALRPPACRRMVLQMQAIAAQISDKVENKIQETEMKLREKQKQKQIEEEALRKAQHIFGPLDKVKAAIRSHRQRKTEQRAPLALAAPPKRTNEENAQPDDGDAGADCDTAYQTDEPADELPPHTAAQPDEPAPDSAAGSTERDDGADDADDEYPGLGE